MLSVLSAFQRLSGSTRVDGTLYYVHQDHLGSTVAVSDAAGGEVGRVQYDPYGEVLTSTLAADLTDRLFTGARFDGTIGLYQMGARWYAPALGRWIQPDTIVPEPGNPQALNRYAYVYNNPLRYVDPSGHGPPVPVPTPTPTPRPPFRPLPTPRRPAYYDYAPLTVDVKPHEECYITAAPPRQVLGSEAVIQAHRPGVGDAILYTLELINAIGAAAAPGQGAGYEMIMPPGQAGLGAFSKGAGSPVPLNTNIPFRSLSRRNFGYNLALLTPKPWGHYDPHHMLSVNVYNIRPEVQQVLNAVGIEIHDPRWGTWWGYKQHGTHRQKWSEFERAWIDWLNTQDPNALTFDMIIGQAESLAKDYGLNWTGDSFYHP